MNLEDFILDFLNYYTNDCTRRIIGIHNHLHSKGHIYRKSKNSNGDPIGRHLSDSLGEEIDLLHGAGFIEDFPEELYNKLPDWMRELDVKVLTEIQSFHDADDYWDGNKGLSELGKEVISELLFRNNIDHSRFKKYLS